jgi:hypothetical protein
MLDQSMLDRAGLDQAGPGQHTEVRHRLHPNGFCRWLPRTAQLHGTFPLPQQ